MKDFFSFEPTHFPSYDAEGHSADLVGDLVGQEGRALPGLARTAEVSSRSLEGYGVAEERSQADVAARVGRHETDTALASPEEIICEARNGRMFILVDDENRKNEGALVIPAQMATPDAINFMATHGRGLICLALTRHRVEELGLSCMSGEDRGLDETAFTVSIEAREGASTGISAADCARTISVAIYGANGPADIVTPGHVFPLVAKDGGVLIRTGHTEAAVDVARLAGLNPSGVICEIMNEDGAMARLADLIPFARKQGLKIGAIRDLVAYRRRHDHLVERHSEAPFKSRWGGDWRAISFVNKATGTTQLVLQKGSVPAAKPSLVRIHRLSQFSDILGRLGQRSDLLSRSMQIIGEEGAGIVVILNAWPSDLMNGIGAGVAKPQLEEFRDYGVGAQILTALGVRDMLLLTNSSRRFVALDGYDLHVTGKRQIDTGLQAG